MRPAVPALFCFPFPGLSDRCRRVFWAVRHRSAPLESVTQAWPPIMPNGIGTTWLCTVLRFRVLFRVIGVQRMRQKNADAQQSEQRRCCVDHRTQSYGASFPFRYIGATLPIPQRWSRRFEAPSCGQGQARLDRTSMANPHVRRKGARRGGKYRASVPRFAF